MQVFVALAASKAVFLSINPFYVPASQMSLLLFKNITLAET